MKSKILKTEQEYNKACKHIYTLINSSEKAIVPDSPEGEEAEKHGYQKFYTVRGH